MLSLSLRLSVIAAIGFSAPAFAKQPPANPTITIAADQWRPINCIPNSTTLGIGIDIVKEIYEPLGYKVNYVVMPWSDALKAEREGKVDAVMGANHSDDPKLLFADSPLVNITDDVYMLRDRAVRYQDTHSLNGMKVGIVKDYGYSKAVQHFVERNGKIAGGIQEAGGDDAQEQNIKKLMSKQIDAMIESKVVMDYKLAQMKLTDKIIRIGGEQQGFVYVAFSPVLTTSTVLLSQYDDGLTRLRATGALDALYKRYSLVPPDDSSLH